MPRIKVMQLKNAIIVLASLLGAAATCARADDSYNNTFRAGLYYIHYDSSADDISGPYVPSGLNLEVNDLVTLYLAYVRTLSDHFDLELAFGYPPLSKTEGRGPATLGSVPYNDQVITTARWIAPTALLNYQFFDPSHALRPYIGIGVNYTTFYDRQSTAAGNAASGGPTSISLTSSVGPAGTVGVQWKLSPRWSLYASYSASMVDSRLTADTAGLIRTTHIDFWPLALVVSGGFSF
jgi:outer membrane protein